MLNMAARLRQRGVDALPSLKPEASAASLTAASLNAAATDGCERWRGRCVPRYQADDRAEAWVNQ